MEPIFRLKTGFFEKTPYRLKVVEKALHLVPVHADGAERIVLAQEDILSITLTERKAPELEIQTQNMLYSGIFEANVSVVEAIGQLKERLNTKFICEYKGGD